MAIHAIAELHYGVDDVAEATRFFEDFGLQLIEKSTVFARFEMPEGSTVMLRKMGDKALPTSKLDGCGVQEVVWGVTSRDTLDRVRENLRADHKITEAADGSIHLVTSFGQALGFKIFNKRPVVTTAAQYNTPGNAARVNQWRVWRKRALPKAVEHVVFNSPDVNTALDFYRSRLNFRVSEVQLGTGVYLRAEGAHEHHNIAFTDSDIPMLRCAGKLTFNHVNFRVDDIDEIMAGKMYMERKGWPPSHLGLGRHRIGSGAFLYMHCAAGGEAEYGADIDLIDDNYAPHVWTQQFGFLLYAHNLPPAMNHEPEWAITFCDGATVRHTPFKEYMASEAAKTAARLDRGY
jgi:catechol 2,3-dioxygenase-like lactoylglutathione lyase family enzyme